MICSAVAQTEDSTATNTKIKVRNADSAIFDNINQNSVQFLKGNVKVSHDSIFMYADSSTIADHEMTAVGKVIIIQNDTVNVFADSMVYNSHSYQAKLFNNVVIDNGSEKLFSDILFYNTKSKIATYQDTAILQNIRTTLTSKSGRYNVNEKMAHFKDQVVVVDEKFEIHADSLDYDMNKEKIIFKGPTWIHKEDQEIYCESGFYNIESGKAYFTKNAFINDKGKISKADEISYTEADSLTILSGNASFENGNERAFANQITFDQSDDLLILKGDAEYYKDDGVIKGPFINYNTKTEQLEIEGRNELVRESKILVSDSLDYEKETGLGYARGNVIWNDTTEQVQIDSDHLKYNENTSYYKAFGNEINPIFLKVSEEDSMYLSADTLISQKIQNPSDTLDNFIAYHDVKIWKKDLRAVADSLYYSSVDSTFRLFGDPIIWADSSQYTGDTIFIKMVDNKVTQIDAFQNGFIINLVIGDYYDQIKGRHITSFLDSSKVKQMDVKGNAESLYFLKDENEAFIGANSTKCSSISFYFETGDLEDIKFYEQPDSQLTPIEQCANDNIYLQKFNWQIEHKPSEMFEDIRLKSNRNIISNTSKIAKTMEKDSLENDSFEQAVNEVIKKAPKKK